MRRMWLSLALAAAVTALIGSVAAVAQYQRTPHSPAGFAFTGPGSGRSGLMSGSGLTGGPGMMAGSGMLYGMVWLAGDGQPVGSIAAARARADQAASPAGLRTGEVIWFDNGFYVELKGANGAPATEVIVDVRTGAVSTEPGPAMMWNTRYGMHRAVEATGPSVSAERARQLATDWLAGNRPGRLAGEPDAYPGYYTMETTTSDGVINGMLSVHAVTGQVWYHSWHGRFITREDR